MLEAIAEIIEMTLRFMVNKIAMAVILPVLCVVMAVVFVAFQVPDSTPFAASQHMILAFWKLFLALLGLAGAVGFLAFIVAVTTKIRDAL